MESLQNVLEKITVENKRAKQIRHYIVIEAVYQISGQIAPLDEIIRLKEKYRYRLLMDESNSFGVLGRSGRGLTEYYDIPIEKIDIVTAAMGHALAAQGGFCTGSARVIDHQRLSSSGYVFSASLPPYVASAAISAIDILEENPNIITKLKDNIALLWAGNFHRYCFVSAVKSPANLGDIKKVYQHNNYSNQILHTIGEQIEQIFTKVCPVCKDFEILSNPHSPMVFLKLKNSMGSKMSDLQLLEDFADQLLKQHNVFVVVSKMSTLDKCPLPVGIRLFVSAGHSESDLEKACEALKNVESSMLMNHT